MFEEEFEIFLARIVRDGISRWHNGVIKPQLRSESH
jgi:hypothetical protein